MLKANKKWNLSIGGFFVTVDSRYKHLRDVSTQFFDLERGAYIENLLYSFLCELFSILVNHAIFNILVENGFLHIKYAKYCDFLFLFLLAMPGKYLSSKFYNIKINIDWILFIHTESPGFSTIILCIRKLNLRRKALHW
jgi:hypothetical protein